MVIRKNKRGDVISTESRRILNNVWGAPDNEILSTSIYYNQDGSLGWDWYRGNPLAKSGSLVMPIYPSVRIGGSPWDESKSEHFPIQWTNVKTLTLEAKYNYLEKPSGSFNLAWDVFFTETDQFSSNPKIKAEVMIWIHATMKQPQAHFKGSFKDGPNTYMLYSWIMNEGKQYYSFLLKGEPSIEGHSFVDAKSLIDRLLDLQSSWFVQGVDLGNEVINGSGKIQVRQVNMNLNGISI